MREIELIKIPVSSFFWRKDGTRWYLVDVNSRTCCSDLTPTQILEFENEVVLSDPMLCDKCWSDLDWPPVNKCPNYGEIEDNRVSLNKIKSFITNWCGAKEPHV